MKLWQKGVDSSQMVDSYTVGLDREFDTMLAREDVLGSLAHIKMLSKVGLMTEEEYKKAKKGLQEVYQKIVVGEFEIESGIEDVHSQVEFSLGEIGKVIHSGRSRNDQVLLDIRLFLRHAVSSIVDDIIPLFNELQQLSSKHAKVLMPGYTHLQVAMPSSFGLWFGAYAEALADDTAQMLAAYKLINRNPLGSAAGYGSSFPLDRKMTSDLLGFDSPVYNVVYAQMTRGKCERAFTQAVASVAHTLARLANDNVMFLNQNFSFISYPAHLTTGSSIMPHKKNPDVWEIMRGKCNILCGLPNQIQLLTTNLPLGYNRDFQLLKEVVFPAIDDIKESLSMAKMMLENVEVKKNILDDKMYDYIFSVESVNNMVLDGVPFRDAYRKIGEMIESGNFEPKREVNHSHLGSIGNLANAKIAQLMRSTLKEFKFDKMQTAENELISE